MSHLANFVWTKDLYKKVVESPQGSFLALCVAVVFAIAVLWTKIFVVVVAGMAGTALSFWMYHLQKSDNPICELKPIMTLRRTTVITATTICTAIIAVGLFVQGITASESHSFVAAVCTAGAYAFFAFSLSSYVFGHQRISAAKRILAQASVEQTHAWHVEAETPQGNTFLRNVF